MCIKHGPCESLLAKLQVSQFDPEEVDPFEMITEKDVAMEDIPYLVSDEDDEIPDIEVKLFKLLNLLDILKLAVVLMCILFFSNTMNVIPCMLRKIT